MLVHLRTLVFFILMIPLVFLPTGFHVSATNWLMLKVIRPSDINMSPNRATISEVLLSVAQPSARGHVFAQLHELERAMNAWEEATGLAPQNPIYALWLGNVLAQLGNGEKAIDAWRQARSSRYWAWQSSIAAQEGRNASAYLLAERSILIDPSDEEARFIVGEMYYRTGNWSQAIESLSVVLESRQQDAQYFNALMLRGQAYIEISNSLDKAHSDFILASRFRPQDPWPYIRLCQVLGLMHKPKDAVTACKQATGLAEDSAFAHYYLGWAFFLNGQFTEAAAEFTRSLEIDPNLQAAQEWLAKTQNRK